MMAAQGFQSRLDQDAKSRVGAVGVMQVTATGREQRVGTSKTRANIHAGGIHAAHARSYLPTSR
jgi:soluble lytic murein transglycosylase-like protein